MGRGPAVSVVIPCYNAGETAEDAVRSALGQTRAPAEVICVDDGSTDDTLQILERLDGTFPGRLTVIAQPNAGANAARNRGLAVATAPYVQFLDADDWLLPRKLEHQLALAEQHGDADIVAGSFTRERVDGHRVVHVARPTDPWVALPWVKLGITSANLFNRDAVVRAGGWNEQYPSSQEYELMFRMLKRESTVAFDPLPLTVLRQRATSITLAAPEANVAQRIALGAEIREHVRRHVGSDEAVEAAETALFCLVRMRCAFSLERGVGSFDEHFDDRYVPPVGFCVSRAYAGLFRWLGFSRAERLRGGLKRLLGPIVRKRHRQRPTPQPGAARPRTRRVETHSF